MPRYSSLLLAPLCVTPVFADLLGPRYPYPRDLSSSKSTIPEAWKNVTSALEKYLEAGPNATIGGVPGLTNTTFSVGLFSLEDEDASKSQFHFTSPLFQIAENGTTSVDENSIYSIASITKVFTVLAGMLNLKDEQWDIPLTELFESAATFADKYSKQDNAEHVQWEKVTLNALSTHSAGIATDPPFPKLIEDGIDPRLYGFPLVDVENDPLTSPGCTDTFTNGDCFVASIGGRGPNNLVWNNPLYSNNGFVLLTAALEEVTGKKYSELLEGIIEPIGMDSTFTSPLPEKELERTVPLSFELATLPADEVGLTVGSGGLLSTLCDMNKFGAAILNSTLLSTEQTRKWMSPIHNTARYEFSMGRPWEILRWKHESGAVSDIYTKAGDSGSAGSVMVLIPDYNVGFTILGAKPISGTSAIVSQIGDIVSAALLPALELQAQREAEHNFAGTYTFSNHGTNATITLSVNNTEGAAPGLHIDNYVSMGVDFQTHPLHAYYFAPGARLQPSILTEETGKFGFRVAIARDAPAVDVSKTLFSGGGNAVHLIGDALSFAGNSLSQFIFDIDESGKATGLTPTALRATLKRQN